MIYFTGVIVVIMTEKRDFQDKNQCKQNRVRRWMPGDLLFLWRGCCLFCLERLDSESLSALPLKPQLIFVLVAFCFFAN